GSVVVVNHWADDVLNGFNKRENNWQTDVSVQQELWSGTGINIGFYRGTYANFPVTDNILVTPQDYDPYCITAPVDSRLPNGGGYKVCDLYDIKPAKFGQINNVVTQPSHFGDWRKVYTGVDTVLTSRFGSGGVVSGGL